MTLKKLMNQKKMQMEMKKMTEMILQSALIRPVGPVVTIPTEPDKLTPQTVTKSVTRRSVKKVRADVPPMLEKKKINV